MWIGILSLLLSLVMPLVQQNDADAAAQQDVTECDPGFVHNDTGPRYSEEASTRAWEDTLAWFRQCLSA
jgi:dienelactone hydrolase